MTPYLDDAGFAALVRLFDCGGPHALVIAGPRGIGKEALARRLAAALLKAPGLASPDGAHTDFLAVGPDPESATEVIGVDAIRRATQQLRLTSGRDGRRVVLIAPADRMNAQAANALLKTLEEPVPGALIILIADRLGALPATLRSRAALWRLAPPTPELGRAALSRLRPDLSDEDARRCLALAGGSPGMAARLADADGLTAWRNLLETLRPLADPEGALSRAAMLQFAAAQGADGWETVATLVRAFLHRAAACAAGQEYAATIAEEDRLIEAYAKRAGLRGTTEASTMAEQIIEQTEVRHLDRRYALHRLLLAIEYGVKAAQRRS